MKKIIIMMFGLLFVASAAFASPSTKGDIVTMNKADSQVLFGDNSVDIVALGSDEMKTTEGEYIKYLYQGGRYIYRNTNFDGYNGISAQFLELIIKRIHPRLSYIFTLEI